MPWNQIGNIKGPPGPPGEPGEPGQPGSPGKSAYELWLDAGNTGTLLDFLGSLEGVPVQILSYLPEDPAEYANTIVLLNQPQGGDN